MKKDIIKYLNNCSEMDYGYSDFMELCVDNLFNAFDKREKDPNEIEDVKILSLLYQIYKDAGGLEDE